MRLSDWNTMTLCWRTWRKIWVYIPTSSYVLLFSRFHTFPGTVLKKKKKNYCCFIFFYAWVSLTDILEKAEHDVQDLPAARKQEVKFLAESRCLSWFPSVTLITGERTGWKGFIYKTLHSIFWLSRDQRKIKWKMPPPVLDHLQDTIVSWRAFYISDEDTLFCCILLNR